MTWVTPRVWVAGERLTASKMNEISSSLSAVYPHTTAGDLAYRDASLAQLARLAHPAVAGKVLRSTATIMEWGGYIAGLAYRSTDQSISNNTNTNAQFGSAPISQSVTWSSGDNTKLTIGVTGVYLIGFVYKFDSGSGTRMANIIKNGSATVLPSRIPAVSGDGTSFGVSNLVSLTAADYLQLQVWQNSGGSLNLQEAYLYAAFIGA